METSKTRRFNIEMRRVADRKNRGQVNPSETPSLWTQSDFSPAQLLRHMETNPLGQLLKLIATLPDVRYDKIERARQQLVLSDEALDERVNLALDRMFEELTTEG
jgi:hypothetical protein